MQKTCPEVSGVEQSLILILTAPFDPETVTRNPMALALVLTVNCSQIKLALCPQH